MQSFLIGDVLGGISLIRNLQNELLQSTFNSYRMCQARYIFWGTKD
jgi:hypothetical protein